MSGMMNALQGVDTLLSGLQAGYYNAIRPISMPTFQPRGVLVSDYNNLVNAYNVLQKTANYNEKQLAAAWRTEKQRADRATRGLQLQAAQKDMEIANLKAEIARLRAGKK